VASCRVASWGMASWGWLQSPFFIVCLKQGHFFLSLFPSISMIFFEFVSQNIMGTEEESGEKVYKYKNMNAHRNLPESCQNLISILESNPAHIGV
jgi:hypothetical protein